MTVPRVADYVRERVPFIRNLLTAEESALAPLLRGNAPLYEALVAMLRGRIERRAKLPVPSNSLKSHERVVADTEDRQIMGRLQVVFHSPVNSPAGDRRDEEPLA